MNIFNLILDCDFFTNIFSFCIHICRFVIISNYLSLYFIFDSISKSKRKCHNKFNKMESINFPTANKLFEINSIATYNCTNFYVIVYYDYGK